MAKYTPNKLADLTDTNLATGAGTDGYAVTWNNANGEFDLQLMSSADIIFGDVAPVVPATTADQLYVDRVSGLIYIADGVDTWSLVPGVQAGTGITMTDGVLEVTDSEIQHNNLNGYDANRHRLILVGTESEISSSPVQGYTPASGDLFVATDTLTFWEYNGASWGQIGGAGGGKNIGITEYNFVDTGSSPGDTNMSANAPPFASTTTIYLDTVPRSGPDMTNFWTQVRVGDLLIFQNSADPENNAAMFSAASVPSVFSGNGSFLCTHIASVGTNWSVGGAYTISYIPNPLAPSMTITDVDGASTTSATPVSALAKTATAAGSYAVTFSCDLYASEAVTATLDIAVAGTPVAASERVVTIPASTTVPFSVTTFVSTTAFQQVQARWQTSAGTLSLNKAQLCLTKVSTPV